MVNTSDLRHGTIPSECHTFDLTFIDVSRIMGNHLYKSKHTIMEKMVNLLMIHRPW